MNGKTESHHAHKKNGHDHNHHQHSDDSEFQNQFHAIKKLKELVRKEKELNESQVSSQNELLKIKELKHKYAEQLLNENTNQNHQNHSQFQGKDQYVSQQPSVIWVDRLTRPSNHSERPLKATNESIIVSNVNQNPEEKIIYENDEYYKDREHVVSVYRRDSVEKNKLKNSSSFTEVGNLRETSEQRKSARTITNAFDTFESQGRRTLHVDHVLSNSQNLINNDQSRITFASQCDQSIRQQNQEFVKQPSIQEAPVSSILLSAVVDDNKNQNGSQSAKLKEHLLSCKIKSQEEIEKEKQRIECLVEYQKENGCFAPCQSEPIESKKEELKEQNKSENRNFNEYISIQNDFDPINNEISPKEFYQTEQKKVDVNQNYNQNAISNFNSKEQIWPNVDQSQIIHRSSVDNFSESNKVSALKEEVKTQIPVRINYENYRSSTNPTNLFEQNPLQRSNVGTSIERSVGNEAEIFVGSSTIVNITETKKNPVVVFSNAISSYQVAPQKPSTNIRSYILKSRSISGTEKNKNEEHQQSSNRTSVYGEYFTQAEFDNQSNPIEQKSFLYVCQRPSNSRIQSNSQKYI